MQENILQNSAAFYDKDSLTNWAEGKFHTLTKRIYGKSTANIILNG